MPKEALFLYKSFNKFAFLFTETVRNVVIDADPGVDDTIALMMAFEAQIRGEINILAITISFGNAPVKNGLKNLAAIMYFYPQFLKVRKTTVLLLLTAPLKNLLSRKRIGITLPSLLG